MANTDITIKVNKLKSDGTSKTSAELMYEFINKSLEYILDHEEKKVPSTMWIVTKDNFKYVDKMQFADGSKLVLYNKNLWKFKP